MITEPCTFNRVEKPWGHEIIWAHTEKFVGKILVIKPNESLSLQFHKQKSEAIYVIEGTLAFHYDGQDYQLFPGNNFLILPGKHHRMSSLGEWVKICEVSTPELDDVVRLQDNYGRT